MPDLTNVGKKGEAKFREWLDRPQEGFWCYRIPDQRTGFFGSTNPCDFFVYHKPNFYYAECKTTYEDRFDFTMLSPNQHDEMLKAAKVDGITSYVVVLFASYQRAFLINILDIEKMEKQKKKSLNITKIAKWPIPYVEIKTIPSRKALLDYDFNQAKEIF